MIKRWKPIVIVVLVATILFLLFIENRKPSDSSIQLGESVTRELQTKGYSKVVIVTEQNYYVNNPHMDSASPEYCKRFVVTALNAEGKNVTLNVSAVASAIGKNVSVVIEK